MTVWPERAAEYSPERVEEITWVPAEQDLRGGSPVREDQTGEPLSGGSPWSTHPIACRPCAPWAFCPAITGNIDIPGGWVFGAHLIGEPPILAEHPFPTT